MSEPLHPFTAADEEAIRAAVAAAEKRSGGEVVPWVVAACDEHPEAAWRGATAGALLGLGAGWLVQTWLGGWGGVLLYGVLPGVAGAAAGFLVGGLAAVKRLLVDEQTLQRRVQTTAEAAFLRAEVFATRQRTGVLIFLALLEHRVVVLADAGIHARVPAGEWQLVADGIVAGIRRGAAAAALVAGIERCGELLAVHGVPLATDDVNELPDRPRFGEER